VVAVVKMKKTLRRFVIALTSVLGIFAAFAISIGAYVGFLSPLLIVGVIAGFFVALVVAAEVAGEAP